MPLETDVLYTCPVCGEENAVGVDVSGGSRQRLIEDCPVCCRPLVFSVAVDREGDALIIAVEAE